MSWFKAIAAATVLQVLTLSPSQAGDNLDAVKSAGVLKIGTEGTYAPFTFSAASSPGVQPT